MRDMRSIPCELSALQVLHDALRATVHSRDDLVRDDVLALSRDLDQIAVRLQRRGIVRTEDGFQLPSEMKKGRPIR